MSGAASERAKYYAKMWAKHMLGRNELAIWLFIFVIIFAQVAIFSTLAEEGLIADIDGLIGAYELLAYLLVFYIVGGVYIAGSIFYEIGYQFGYFDAEDLVGDEA